MIYNNEFVDLIVNNYSESNPQQNVFLSGCVNEIIEKIAIFHNQRTKDYLTNLETIPYSSIPKLFGLMDSTNMEITGVKQVQNPSFLGLNGEGTIVGIIDTGIAYDNPLFFDANGQSRIGVIWDQSIPGKMSGEKKEPLQPLFGTVYEREEINNALKTENPYEVVPTKDENGHGTFMAGIAAGGVDIQNDFTGIATKAEIAVVKLKEAKPYLREYFQIQADVPAYEESDIIYAVEYLVQYANYKRKPLSLLIGVGSSNGGHSGYTYLELYLSRLLENVGLMISVPAGNEGSAGLHYYGELSSKEEYQDVEINLDARQKGLALEFWGRAPSVFSIGLQSPKGERIDQISPRFGKEESITLPLSGTELYVAYQIAEAYSGDEFVFIRLKNPTPGIWKIRIESRDEGKKEFHMWMPLRQFLHKETFFLKSNSENTIVVPGNTRLTMVMTAYNHRNGSLYPDASRGYTTTGLVKPDLAAPGVEITGPGLRNNYVTRTGSSVAAAHSAGIMSLFLQWDFEYFQQGLFFAGQIQSLFLKGGNRLYDTYYPNSVWGYGKLDLLQTFQIFSTSNYPI